MKVDLDKAKQAREILATPLPIEFYNGDRNKPIFRSDTKEKWDARDYALSVALDALITAEEIFNDPASHIVVPRATLQLISDFLADSHDEGPAGGEYDSLVLSRLKAEIFVLLEDGK